MSENNSQRDTVAGLNDYALKVLGCDKEKILEAVKACVAAMGELTIEESKIARKYLGNVMEEMYKRSPDTIISTIPYAL